MEEWMKAFDEMFSDEITIENITVDELIDIANEVVGDSMFVPARFDDPYCEGAVRFIGDSKIHLFIMRNPNDSAYPPSMRNRRFIHFEWMNRDDKWKPYAGGCTSINDLKEKIAKYSY